MHKATPMPKDPNHIPRVTVDFLSLAGKDIRDKLGLDKHGKEKGVEVGYDSDYSQSSRRKHKKKDNSRNHHGGGGSARDPSPRKSPNKHSHRPSNR